MAGQRGRNAGVTGLVDIEGAHSFDARIYKFTHQIGTGQIVRTKRGDKFKRIRQSTPGSTLILSGKVRQAGYPLPSNIKGATGSIVLQFNDTAKLTLSVTVLDGSVTFNEEKEDLWDIRLTCEVTANPSLAGFTGTQTTVNTDPSYEAVQTHEGIAKGVDPDGLQDEDQFRYDLDGLTDTSAAETTAVTDLIGAYVATRAGMKLRRAELQRTDAWGGVVVVTCARTTSKEDVINAATMLKTDPSGLDGQAVTAAFNGTPATSSGLVSRGTTTKEYNDDQILKTTEYGERTTGDDATFDKTRVATDASELEQEDSYAVIFTTGGSPSAPTRAGMVVTDYVDVPLTNASASNLSVRIYRMSYSTNAQKVTQPRYSIETDPNGLDTVKRWAVIWDGSSPPSDPTLTGVLSGFKLLSKTDIGLASHPTKLVRVYQWEKNDSLDKRILPHTWLLADPSNITSHGEKAELNTTPTAPVGYKSRGVKGEYQNGTDLLNILQYGLNSEGDDETHGNTVAEAESFRGNSFEIATLSASTNAASVIAKSQFTAFKDQVTWEGVKVKKLNDGLALIISRTRDDEIIVAFDARARGQIPTPAYWDGTDVWVFLKNKIKVGTNLWQFELAPQYRRGTSMRVNVHRRLAGTSIALVEGSMDTSNNAAFLGLGTGKVSYQGIAGESNISISGTRVNRIVYTFDYDSLGIIDQGTCVMGWQWTTTNLTSVTPGWVKATDLGVTASVLAAVSYAGFIT